MKLNPLVSSSIRKNRLAHRNKSQTNRRIRMSSTLSKDLRAKYSFRSIPIVKNDEVVVISGKYKGRSGKVTDVSRRTYKVNVDGCNVVANGHSRPDDIDVSNLCVTKLCFDFKRKAVVEKKSMKYKEKKEKVGRI